MIVRIRTRLPFHESNWPVLSLASAAQSNPTTFVGSSLTLTQNPAARDLYHRDTRALILQSSYAIQAQAHGVLNVRIPVLMVLTPAGVGMHANIASSDPYNTLDTVTVQHVDRRVFKPPYVLVARSAIAGQRSAEGTTDSILMAVPSRSAEAFASWRGLRLEKGPI
jgi:hypothetical protein